MTQSWVGLHQRRRLTAFVTPTDAHLSEVGFGDNRWFPRTRGDDSMDNLQQRHSRSREDYGENPTVPGPRKGAGLYFQKGDRRPADVRMHQSMNTNSRAFRAALKKVMRENADDPNMIGFPEEIRLSASIQPDLPRQGVIDFCYAVWDISAGKRHRRAKSMATLLSRKIHGMARLLEENPRGKTAGAKARAKDLRSLARYVSIFDEHEANVSVALAILYRSAPEGSSIDDFFNIDEGEE